MWAQLLQVHAEVCSSGWIGTRQELKEVIAGAVMMQMCGLYCKLRPTLHVQLIRMCQES